MKLNDGLYLFDTTIFIDFMRARPVAQRIISQALAEPGIQAGYSIVTEAEIWAGLRKPGDEKRIRHALSKLQRYFINVTIAHRAGELQAQIAMTRNQSVPQIVDCLIAATADYHGLTVCSANTQHFRLFTQVGISVLEYKL